MSIDPTDFASVTQRANDLLLAARNEHGWWTGRLSTSALSTATAVQSLRMAAAATFDVHQRERWQSLVRRGLDWLAAHQNDDGGWGDTVLSISNISTTMLAHAVFHATRLDRSDPSDRTDQVVTAAAAYIDRAGGIAAVRRRYGKDQTFSVPILTHCALAGTVDWKHVTPLPFELAWVPHQLYAAVRMPVVSYALPALIAIGQVISRHRRHWNPMTRLLRRAATGPTLRILESIQPDNGGFLEATPLTSFVCMSLLGCDLFGHRVTQKCLAFIEASMRDDGSWPIDTNLTTWVTTLSVNALCGKSGERKAESGANESQGDSGFPLSDFRFDPAPIRLWLLSQQYRTAHPYTHAAPGGWSWTDLPGGVPDADDTPGAMLALMNLRRDGDAIPDDELQALRAAADWLLGLQNRDGGWPTFCRGWGTLDFDRSSSDITAHVLRALHRFTAIAASDRINEAIGAGIRFLETRQRLDGTWLPLWFGHQHHEDDRNPLYGTSRVVRALSDIGRSETRACEKAVTWLLASQNDDGGWSARRGLVSSVEETGLALDSLARIPVASDACARAARWLVDRVNKGTIAEPSPIGFYFAKLWYYEELYPLIFAAAGLNRWCAATRASA